MKHLTLLFTIAIHTCYLFGQSQTIVDWRNSHREVLVFSQQDFDVLSEKNKQRVQGNYIVTPTGELDWIDIELYESELKTKGISYSIDPDSGEEIKKWIAEHPDTKIMTREYFNQLSKERQELYLEYGTLILGRNILTISDIERHEASY